MKKVGKVLICLTAVALVIIFGTFGSNAREYQVREESCLKSGMNKGVFANFDFGSGGCPDGKGSCGGMVN